MNPLGAAVTDESQMRSIREPPEDPTNVGAGADVFVKKEELPKLPPEAPCTGDTSPASLMRYSCPSEELRCP